MAGEASMQAESKDARHVADELVLQDGLPLEEIERRVGIAIVSAGLRHRAGAFYLRDIHERGLNDKILLIVTGEMGRTPRINKNGGRDHYGELTSLLFAGGGLNLGQVIGQSDHHASRPATEPFTPQHLLGTVMHTLFDMGELRIEPGLPTDIVRPLDQVKPIPGVL